MAGNELHDFPVSLLWWLLLNNLQQLKAYISVWISCRLVLLRQDAFLPWSSIQCSGKQISHSWWYGGILQFSQRMDDPWVFRSSEKLPQEKCTLYSLSAGWWTSMYRSNNSLPLWHCRIRQWRILLAEYSEWYYVCHVLADITFIHFMYEPIKTISDFYSSRL